MALVPGFEVPVSADAKARAPIGLIGVRVRLGEPTGLDLETAWRRLHSAWRGRTREEVKAETRLAATAQLFRSLGINPKDNPPAAQNLIIRYLNRPELDRIPRINPAVDAVNLAVAEERIPLAAFDANQVVGEMRLRTSQGGERLVAIGGQTLEIPAGTIVLADEGGVLSWFGYRDGDRQKVAEGARELVLLACVIPGLEEAAETALKAAVRHLGEAFDRIELE